MEYFLRHEVDGVNEINMTLVRLGLVAFIILIVRFRKNVRILKALFTLSLVLQVLLFYWYTRNLSLLFKEGLPLYHCRLAGLAMPIAFILGKKKTLVYFSDLAMIGTVVAFSFPDPSPYSWPHVTNLTYVVNHYVLMACGVLVAMRYQKRLGFKDILTRTFLINLVIFFLDLYLKANYGYLISLPLAYFKDFSPFVIAPSLSIIMAIAILLMEYVKTLLRK